MSRSLSRVTPILIRRLVKMSIPVPPQEIFERAIGYSENQRFVAFYFDDDGHIYYEDAATWDFGNQEPFALWSQIVPEWRLEIDCACIQEPAPDGKRNWLLFDRNTRIMYFGPRENVIPIIAGQLPLPGRAGRPTWELIRADVIIGLSKWLDSLENGY